MDNWESNKLVSHRVFFKNEIVNRNSYYRMLSQFCFPIALPSLKSWYRSRMMLHCIISMSTIIGGPISRPWHPPDLPPCVNFCKFLVKHQVNWDSTRKANYARQNRHFSFFPLSLSSIFPIPFQFHIYSVSFSFLVLSTFLNFSKRTQSKPPNERTSTL